jgi:hypothetical protein
MSLICRGLVSLSLEYMSEMTTAICQLLTNDETQDLAHQLAQVISMRVMNIDLSSCRLTAPGMVSKKAGHPHPDALMIQLKPAGLYRDSLQLLVGCVQWGVTSGTGCLLDCSDTKWGSGAYCKHPDPWDPSYRKDEIQVVPCLSASRS